MIALARDPDIDISQVAAAISRDPALAAKLLRVANSALYSRHRKSTNLRQALIALGLQGATTLALGLSLVGTFRALKSNGLDYDRYWRRTILSTSAARCFGALRKESTVDDIFLAALLQDIAVIGVDRALPNLYRDLPRTASHRDLSAHEMKRLGVDHAAIGAWLLEYWKLPESLCGAVAWSHGPPPAERATALWLTACCVALGSECVEILLAPAEADISTLAQHAWEWLGIDAPAVAAVMANIVGEIPEIERLFEIDLLKPDAANAILDEALDLLSLRNLGKLTEPEPLPIQRPETPASPPRDERCRDGLTGLYNRGYLDLLLRREIQAATRGEWPLSVVFVDLGGLRSIKDTYGKEAGDSILVTTANSIADVARETDYLARYGGAEFVIILPGLEPSGAEIFCERLMARLCGTRHPFRTTNLTVSASVGLATHSPETPFQRASQLIVAAQRSSYVVKKSRYVVKKSGSVPRVRDVSKRPVSGANK